VERREKTGGQWGTARRRSRTTCARLCIHIEHKCIVIRIPSCIHICVGIRIRRLKKNHWFNGRVEGGFFRLTAIRCDGFSVIEVHQSHGRILLALLE
jgi:hypothetical protein